MTADKKQPTAQEAARKAWVPKSPTDVVLEQIGKQEKKVAALQKDLDQEKLVLAKLAKAKAVLEA